MKKYKLVIKTTREDNGYSHKVIRNDKGVCNYLSEIIDETKRYNESKLEERLKQSSYIITKIETNNYK